VVASTKAFVSAIQSARIDRAGRGPRGTVRDTAVGESVTRDPAVVLAIVPSVRELAVHIIDTHHTWLGTRAR
jgi:hypothetical protein